MKIDKEDIFRIAIIVGLLVGSLFLWIISSYVQKIHTLTQDYVYSQTQTEDNSESD